MLVDTGTVALHRHTAAVAVVVAAAAVAVVAAALHTRQQDLG